MEEKLQQMLANRDAKRLHEAGRELSAVLLPVYFIERELYLLFTRRTQKVKSHKGQISFPGGVYQAEDETLLNTALRECEEEIGLTPERVELLGQLDDVLTMTSNYIITPFVALIPHPYEFKLSRQEIEEIIEVPVSALLEESCFREDTEMVDGKRVSTYFYTYQGNVIWGATAIILNQFLGIFIQAANN